MRKYLIAGLLAVAATLGLALPADATWTWGPDISVNAAERAAVDLNPGAFVVPMTTATDNLFCNQYGGKIYNQPYSDFAIAVTTGCANNGVPVGHWSNEWTTMRDVDWFYVKGGHACMNTDTRYVYKGTGSMGTYTGYRLVSDLTYLRLNCYVLGI